MRNGFILGFAVFGMLSSGSSVSAFRPIAEDHSNTDRVSLNSVTKPAKVRYVDADLEVDQIAPNVYAFVSNNTTHDWEDGNSMVIIGDDGVAVIDAPSTFLTRRHLIEIRKLTYKPVRYVINTHFHRDHVMGNHVYKDAFPDVTIIQQEYTSAIADRRDPLAIEDLKGKGGSELLRRLKDEAERGVDSKGNPLVGYSLERAKRSYREFLPVYESAQSTRYIPADITFQTSMTLKLGSTEIQLLHLPGHTPGDTAVWLSNEKILATGDLVIGPVPYGGPDQYLDWIVSLEKLMALQPSAIVPGHGAVEYSQAYMAQEHDLFEELMKQAVSAVKKGQSLDEFKKTLDLSAFEVSFVHGDPELLWGWDNYFVGINGALAARAYRTAFGNL